MANNSGALLCSLLQWWGVNAAVKAQALDWFGADFTVAVLVSQRATAGPEGESCLSACELCLTCALLSSSCLKDLYRGASAGSVAAASHLMQSLDFVQALRDVRATVKYLKEQEGCTKVRDGIDSQLSLSRHEVTPVVTLPDPRDSV